MTSEQARAVVDVLTSAIEQESAATQKAIAAVPHDNLADTPR